MDHLETKSTSEMETAVFGLWVTPRFPQEVDDGQATPPYVNHDEIDWVDLAGRLSQALCAPQHAITLRLPDDTIDAATLLVRRSGGDMREIQCQDFGERLLAAARLSDPLHPIIGIRADWAELHYITDRKQSPPPSLIPMVCSGRSAQPLDFFAHAQAALSIQALALPLEGVEQAPPHEAFHGTLPHRIRDALKNTFGVDFEDGCLFHFMIDSSYLVAQRNNGDSNPQSQEIRGI